MPSPATFPPYHLLDAPTDAEQKTRRLERLYHMTQGYAWDGRTVLGDLVEKHGDPGAEMDSDTRRSLSRVMSILMWGELAAWNISADLALAIDDMDAKMAATGQVFDEARHFYVMRDYVQMLGPAPPLGAIPKRLLRKVLGAPTLATKLIGMQLLFETNAVVIFRRIAESKICPVLTELLPYFERDESRHVGLGVLYVPRLIARMSRLEALRTARFQAQCVTLLAAGGFTVRSDFERLGLDQRLMATRVTNMQDEIVRQMAEAHGHGVLRAVVSPKDGLGPRILDFIHPPGGIDQARPAHRIAHEALSRGLNAIDRALA